MEGVAHALRRMFNNASALCTGAARTPRRLEWKSPPGLVEAAFVHQAAPPAITAWDECRAGASGKRRRVAFAALVKGLSDYIASGA
jgi:hypothetical protein